MSTDQIHQIEGPVLLLAGPGTGKTYRLAKRLKYLISEMGVSPEEISVITFTTAAAQNMLDRISDENDPDLYIELLKQPKRICTMHSFGYSIIREHADQLGIDETLRVINDDYLRSLLIGDAAQIAGHKRQDAKETVDCRQAGGCMHDESLKCQVCDRYKDIMRICAAIDYDEQILLACDILRRNQSILEKYRKSTKHLLVDEYQDINAAQYALIRLLSEHNLAGLFVVGDDDQSIYSWRGGSPEYIRNFAKDFGDTARTVPLLHSYRCHRNVLEGSLGIVQKYDPRRLPKGEFSYKREDGPKIVIHSTPTDEKEAKEVRKIVQRVLPAQDVLVLFPNRQFSGAITKELRSARIPFTAPASIPGSGLPLVSVLADWASSPIDSLSLRRILEAVLESPALGVPSHRARKPEKKLERENALRLIANLWQPILECKAANLWEVLEQAQNSQSIVGKIYTALKDLLDCSKDTSSLEAMLIAIAQHLAPWRKSQDFLAEAASWVEALSYSNQTSQRSNVRLMTFQSAKGLEAKIVCVIGLEDRIIPREGEDVDVSEQSRLLFVSMTRAKNELHLFHARKRSSFVVQRNIYQNAGPPDLSRSRFLDAIDNSHCESAYHRY